MIFRAHAHLMFAAIQGFLYVLDSKGQSREGWPIQMGEIQVAT